MTRRWKIKVIGKDVVKCGQDRALFLLAENLRDGMANNRTRLFDFFFRQACCYTDLQGRGNSLLRLGTV